jgi:hypothetical protein
MDWSYQSLPLLPAYCVSMIGVEQKVLLSLSTFNFGSDQLAISWTRPSRDLIFVNHRREISLLMPLENL